MPSASEAASQASPALVRAVALRGRTPFTKSSTLSLRSRKVPVKRLARVDSGQVCRPDVQVFRIDKGALAELSSNETVFANFLTEFR